MSTESMVTQADRDAAAEAIWRGEFSDTESREDEIRRGDADNHPMVQAFARHRHHHQPQEREAVLDICPACNGSGVGVADTLCVRCTGCGGVLTTPAPAVREAVLEEALRLLASGEPPNPPSFYHDGKQYLGITLEQKAQIVAALTTPAPAVSTTCENTHCGDSSRCFECDGCRAFSAAMDAPAVSTDEIVELVQQIETGASLGSKLFVERVEQRKGRLTWYAVNVLQDNLAACEGSARAILSRIRGEGE